jgi:hypothetical protein
MDQLMLINPRRRVRRRNSRKGRMPAALAAYWATHRRGKKRTRLANPRRRRRNPGAFAMHKRRRRRSHIRNPRRYHARRHHRNSRRRHHYRRMRNPRRSSGGGTRFSMRGIVHEAIVPAAVGTGGALALNVLMGYANPYLPAQLQSTSGTFNPLNALLQVAGAVGVGAAAMKFMGRSRGGTVMLGALTVTFYSIVRNFTAGSGIPGLSGIGLTDYTPFPTSRTVGAYLPRRTAGGRVGYVTPGTVVGPTLAPRMGAYMPRAMNVMPEETGI